MKILGIETSCDETAISVVGARGDLNSLHFKVLGSAVHSQIKMHAEYGGVVPNLAKREHIKNLPIVLEEALTKAAESLELKAESKDFDPKTPKSKLSALNSYIDLIAVTVGPGLEPALWTGIKFAEELGQKWNIPVIPANHMEGHIASVLIKEVEKLESEKAQVKSGIDFPALALLISGGHTEFVLLKNWIEKEKIGQTLDDAVGEAFDKVARMLGLPYPGGPEISRLAEMAREQNVLLERRFPRPMIHSKNLNFSFSGLKTAVLYYLKDLKNYSREQLSERDWRESEEIFQQKNTPVARENNFSDLEKMAVAREFEDAVIETLISKTKKAIETYSPKTFIIGGGVIANKALRENFLKLKENYKDLEILIPQKSLTTDNATMIAAAGFIEYLRNGASMTELKAQGNLSLS